MREDADCPAEALRLPSTPNWRRWSVTGGSDPAIEAIRVDGTTVTTIPGLAGTAGDVAYDIDDAGTTVVGASFLSNGESRGWTNDGTETTQLESFGSTYEIASRINNAGVIAGSARDGSGQMHLVAWQGGAIADIGGGAYSSASVSDINEAGHVLGFRHGAA